MDKIFIGIASFLDYEIRETILDCIKKAKFPQRLVFSVCLQYDENVGTDSCCIDDLIDTYDIKVKKYHYSVSNGGCWARNIVQSMYSGEKYSLQVDSHTRFVVNWDEIIINDYLDLKKISNKPLITCMPPYYLRDDANNVDTFFENEKELNRFHIPLIKSLSEEYWVRIEHNILIDSCFKNNKMFVLQGGFVFSDGDWVVAVKQDPNHYYTGEEFALAIRSFTHGYDLYTPKRFICWHRSHNSPNIKHWTATSQDIGTKLHKKAMARLKMLIEEEFFGEYGLGKERTIQDYCDFSGVNFKTKTVSNLLNLY